MPPPRPSGGFPAPSVPHRSGSVAYPQMTYDAVKNRVLAKLEERLDMSASKRMPQSLLRQSLRQHADQITDQEARGFAKADRDRIIDEVLAELLGYGPLEELFADPAVREVMVTGPGAVIARRDQAQWLPTSVKFRDEAHVRATLDRIATHADAVGPVMATMAVFDMKLPNGFRALAVIPPEGLDQPATAVFVREKTIPVPSAAPVPGAPAASPRAPGSGPVQTPAPRSESAATGAVAAPDLLARHRNRITERLLSKFASLGLYDVSRLDVNELRRIIGAYIGEYAAAERVYLSDTDQGRLTLEILTSLRK
ncbi:MAG: hypothetical protein FJ304_13040 [Planctomycetes bacterium]|nr:hypothetical protein [Planctomycetota bacterium]